MTAAEAAHKAELFAACERAIGQADRLWFVPGRIEVFGKHTDYAGGRSLLCTAERGICVAARRRTDSLIRMADAITGEVGEYAMSADFESPQRGWMIYPRTVARRIARNFPGAVRGADIAIASDLPRASGMSSSSALVTGVFSAISALNELEKRPEYITNIHTREDLAGYLGCVENGQTFGTLTGDAGVGTFGGSEDHTAILCCRPGELSQYSFCPNRLERVVPIPADCVLVIAVSGVTASKTVAAKDSYNNLSLSVTAILGAWQQEAESNPRTLAEAVRSSPEAADRIRALLPKIASTGMDVNWLRARFDQFVLESEQFVGDAADCLARGDLQGFGHAAERSQAAAEAGLRNQVAETIFLANVAQECGARAASAFGAGFGGSVWALVNGREASEFAQRWRERYLSNFPERAHTANFFATAAGPALTQIA